MDKKYVDFEKLIELPLGLDATILYLSKLRDDHKDSVSLDIMFDSNYFTMLVGKRLETDEEYLQRMNYEKGVHKKINKKQTDKQKRYEKYLKLKKEFES